MRSGGVNGVSSFAFLGISSLSNVTLHYVYYDPPLLRLAFLFFLFPFPLPLLSFPFPLLSFALSPGSDCIAVSVIRLWQPATQMQRSAKRQATGQPAQLFHLN